MMQVFYMKSTMLKGQDKLCGTIPSMNGWTTKQLKDRQSKEVKNGGFGKVTFATDVQFVDDVGYVEATPVSVGTTITKAPSIGTCKERIHDSKSDMIVMIQNENTYRDGYYDKHNDYSTQEYRDMFEDDEWDNEEPNDCGDEEMSIEVIFFQLNHE